MIRTLVVDDSFFMRKILTDILSGDPAIEVVGQASSGEEAVEMAKALKLDVITMDIVMGGRVDGVQATKNILQSRKPAPSIIIVSANTKKGSALSVDCLRAGAFAIVDKPSGEVSLDIESVAEKLIALVKKSREAHLSAPVKPLTFIDLIPRKIVIIGASTGGPPVLELICSSLDALLPAPLLIAQHIPPHFTASLSHDLDRICGLKVKEIRHREPLKSSCIHICPGGCHTTLRKEGRTRSTFISAELSEAETGGMQGSIPSIDTLMESAAMIFGRRAIGILLTGMGNDGTAGMRAIKEAGGRTIVQDPETCVMDSMVRNVIDAKLADEVLKPEKIAKRIKELAQ